MKKLYLILLISVTFAAFYLTGCKFEYTPTAKSVIKSNQWDSKNIPDKHNCGPDESTNFTVLTETAEIYPGVKLVLREDTNQYNLSWYQNKTLPSKFTVSNYDFSGHDFVTNGMDKYTGKIYVTFENCKFKGFRNDAVGLTAKGKVYFTFNHCSFGGGVNNSYITLNNCKIGGFTSDGMNPLREFYANNLYV